MGTISGASWEATGSLVWTGSKSSAGMARVSSKWVGFTTLGIMERWLLGDSMMVLWPTGFFFFLWGAAGGSADPMINHYFPFYQFSVVWPGHSWTTCSVLPPVTCITLDCLLSGPYFCVTGHAVVSIWRHGAWLLELMVVVALLDEREVICRWMATCVYPKAKLTWATPS